MAELGQLYYTLTAKDKGLAKVIADAKKELKSFDNQMVDFNKTDKTSKIGEGFATAGKTIEQLKSQLKNLESVWVKLNVSDTSGQRNVIDMYKQLQSAANAYGISLKSTVISELGFSNAMSMQATTLD